MKFTIIRFRVALFCAVLLLSISVLSNRVALAKGHSAFTLNVANDNLPAEFVRTTNLSGTTKDVFQKINYERRLKDLKPLLWNDDLADMAYDYSKKMAKEDFFAHFDNDGKSIVDRAEEYKIDDWLKLGENLFQCSGYLNPVDIAVKGWLKSPTHRDNIYDRDFTHTGIGVYADNNSGIFMTQVFMKK